MSALFGPAMTYRHNGAFTAAGQVRINDIAGADVLVEVNTGGTLAADFAIRLAGHHARQHDGERFHLVSGPQARRIAWSCLLPDDADPIPKFPSRRERGGTLFATLPPGGKTHPGRVGD